MKWITNLFGVSEAEVKTEIKTKTKFSVRLNRCNVSRVPIADKTFSVVSRPGKTFEVEIEMNESDVLVYDKLDKELRKFNADLYYDDVLKITNISTGAVVKEKNIREYYSGVPEDEFVKLGF